MNILHQWNLLIRPWVGNLRHNFNTLGVQHDSASHNGPICSFELPHRCHSESLEKNVLCLAASQLASETICSYRAPTRSKIFIVWARESCQSQHLLHESCIEECNTIFVDVKMTLASATQALVFNMCTPIEYLERIQSRCNHIKNFTAVEEFWWMMQPHNNSQHQSNTPDTSTWGRISNLCRGIANRRHYNNPSSGRGRASCTGFDESWLLMCHALPCSSCFSDNSTVSRTHIAGFHRSLNDATWHDGTLQPSLPSELPVSCSLTMLTMDSMAHRKKAALHSAQKAMPSLRSIKLIKVQAFVPILLNKDINNDIPKTTTDSEVQMSCPERRF